MSTPLGAVGAVPALRRETAARVAVVTVAACTYARLFWPLDALLWAASAALVLFALAAWPTVSRQARVFAGLALCACAALVAFTPEGAGVLREGFAQSTQFATLLAALATLRLPMRRSPLIPRAAAWLVAAPPRRRHATVTFGSHWLSLMFMFGVVPMMGEMLRRRGLDARESATARHMMVGVIRGLAFTTAWSPMAISFAIVSTALPGLHPLAFVALGMLAAALVLAADCLQSRDQDPAGEAVPSTPADVGGARALAAILAMAVLLFGATYALWRASGWSFVMCSAALLPCFAALWYAATPREGGAPPTALQFFTVLTETRSEVFIFSASTFIGQAIVTATLLALGGAHGGGLPLPALVLAWLCLWTIPLVAAVSVAPTIVVLVWAQAIALSGAGAATPLTFALAMTLGWSLAICVSPVSATLLIAGAITGVAPREIALRWNLGFVLAAGLGCSVFLAALYLLRL